MGKRSTKPAETSVPAEVTDPFAEVRNDLLTEIGYQFTGVRQSAMHEDGAFRKGVKIAPVAREIGIPQITLAAFLRGQKGVSVKTYKRLEGFIASRRTVEGVTDEQAEALAEAESL